MMRAEEDGKGANIGTTSFFKTTFNGLNTLLGIGTLSIPYALSSGGWLRLILVLIVACAMCYTGLLMKRCMESDPHLKTYPDIGGKAFGPKGRLIVSIVMNLELYLVAVGFLIQVADNMHNLFPNVHLNIRGFVIKGKQTFLMLSALIVMPSVWIDNLTALSYVSATGVMATVIIACSVLLLGTFEGVGFHQHGELFIWSGLPTCGGLYTLCYGGHSVFPTLYSSMTNPKLFKSVLILCFVITTLACSSMAISGYLMFGSEVEPQITLNLPRNKLSSKVAIYTALVNPLAKYALFLKPIVDAIEIRVCRLWSRSILMGTTLAVALALPYYDILMSIVGAFTVAIAAILLPCFCYLKIFRPRIKRGFDLAMIGLVVIMGFIILFIGTYECFVQIFHRYKGIECSLIPSNPLY